MPYLVLFLTLLCCCGHSWGYAEQAEASYNLAKGVYHKARPAKKESRSDVFSQMSDNDIHEQIEIYSAVDEDAFVTHVCAENCYEPSVVSTVDRRFIEDSGARNLQDILQMLPGFNVSKEVNGFVSVKYQGFGVSLSLDGAVLQDPDNARNYWDISADVIEKVEINKVPDALNFGSGALSANLNVVSRKQKGFHLKLAKSSFSAYSGSLVLGGEIGPSNNSLASSISVTEGPSLPIERPVLTDGSGGQNLREVFTNASSKSFSVLLNSEILFAKETSSKLHFNAFVFGEQRGPYVGLQDASGPNSKLSWLLWNAFVKWQFPYGEENNFAFKVSSGQNYVHNIYELGLYGSEKNKADEKYKTLQFNAEIKNKFRLYEGNFLSIMGEIGVAGILSSRQGQNLNNGLYEDAPQIETCSIYGYKTDMFKACRFTISAMILDEWQVDKALKLFAGFRVFSASDLEFDYSSHISPKVGIILFPDRKWTVKLLFSQGVRLPSFAEINDLSSQFIGPLQSGQSWGSNLLKPEVTRALKLNVAHQNYHKGVSYFVEIAGSLSKTLQAIETRSAFIEETNLTNKGRYFSFGLEGSAKAVFIDGSYLFANLSWFRSFSWLADENSQPVNKAILQRKLPELQLNVGSNLVLGKFGNLFVVVEMGSERKSDDWPPIEEKRKFKIAPFAVVNASFRSHPIFDTFTIQASVFNLFNFALKDVAARPDLLPGLVPLAGITWYVGISATI